MFTFFDVYFKVPGSEMIHQIVFESYDSALDFVHFIIFVKHWTLVSFSDWSVDTEEAYKKFVEVYNS